MTTRAKMLAQRRRDLVAACNAQRSELISQAPPVKHLLTSFDAGLRIVNRVERHPGWLVVAVGGLIVIRPRRLSSLLRLGTTGLRTWRQLAPILEYLTLRRQQHPAPETLFNPFRIPRPVPCRAQPLPSLPS